MAKIYMTSELFQAVSSVIERGHGVELEALEGGNSHSSVKITIGFKKAGSQGYVKKIDVKMTRSYGQFVEFLGMDGEKSYYPQVSILPFLDEFDTIPA